VSAELLALALVVAVAAYILMGRWARRRRGALGIGAGALVSADDSLSRSPTLRSARLGLAGRCDHLLRVEDAYVPVEQKPSAGRLQQSHVLQVGALCLLVQEVYGVRPPYGVVVLAGGRQERVAFSEELERVVVRTMAETRRILATGEPPDPQWVGAKCRACGYHPVCWGGDPTAPIAGPPGRAAG
jgi:CRISPR-associated exonuclease Cas4